MRGRLHALEVELADLLDVIEHLRELDRHAVDLLVAQLEPGETGDVQDLGAIKHPADSRSRAVIYEPLALGSRIVSISAGASRAAMPSWRID